jgi:uncharacterized iron-regulated protein
VRHLKRPSRWAWLCAAVLLCACASGPPPDFNSRLTALLPTDALLLGEQHDAPEHQQLHRSVIDALAAQGTLASVAIEMAEQGHSTAQLGRQATQAQVRTALQWNEGQWPWDAYGPAIMAAVGAGIPVIGANLPRTQMAAAMRDTALDNLLTEPARTTLQQLIRQGHCDTLPERQIAPMTRIQIARDVAMANTITGALKPEKTVVLLAGSTHANRALGVAQHMAPSVRVRTLLFQAANPAPEATDRGAFDQVWPTQPVPPKDYCAELVRHKRP